MKVELYLDTPETLAVFAEFLPKYQSALAAAEARFAAQRPLGGNVLNPPVQGVVTTEAVAEVVDDKPAPPTPTSRKPRKAVEPKAAPEPPAEVQEELKLADPVAADPAVVVEEVVTIDDVRRHLRIYGSDKGADALTALYAEYGVQKLSDLPESKFAEIIAKVSA